MQKKLKTFRDAFLYPAAACFTVTLFLVCSLAKLFASGQGTSLSFSTDLVLLILGFSVGFALCGLIFRIRSLNLIVKVALHFTGTLLCFIVFLVVLSGYFANTSGGLWAALIYTFFYAIAAAVILGLRAFFRRKKTESGAYTPLFDKLKKN